MTPATQSLAEAAALLTDVAENEITVLTVGPDDINSERNYRVDHERKALIEVPNREGGTRFGVQELRAEY